MQICEIWLCFTWNSSAPPKNKNNRQKKNIQTYVIYLLRAHPSKINIFCNGWNVADRTEKLLFYFSGSVIFHFMLWVLLTPRAPGVHTSHAKPIIDTPFPVWYAFSRPLYIHFFASACAPTEPLLPSSHMLGQLLCTSTYGHTYLVSLSSPNTRGLLEFMGIGVRVYVAVDKILRPTDWVHRV